MGQNHKPKHKLRRIDYSLAALLYNLWIVVRNMVGKLASYEFKDILSIQLNAASPPDTFGTCLWSAALS